MTKGRSAKGAVEQSHTGKLAHVEQGMQADQPSSIECNSQPQKDTLEGMAFTAANQPQQPPAPVWLPLREELRLSQGPPTDQGAPSWTLHDAAAHRFYRIGWLEFEVLSRWRHKSAEAIHASICHETTLTPALPLVQAVYDFALRNNLVTPVTAQDTARLLQIKSTSVTSLGHKILHGYLFLRIPLLAPDAWLTAALPWVRWMFSKAFFTVLICLSLLGLYLVSREWVEFLLNLESLWSWQQSIMVVLALGLAKTVHEFGHAFAAKFLGLRVPRMGIALMCFSPVLWTDVTEAWKLPKRSERLLVDMAGVGAELILATTASLIWPLLPPGAAKSAVLTLAGVTWIATLVVNANPFMRYDGYYILSDYWEVPGLQQRSFALARWNLREIVFGFGDSPPEAMQPDTKRKLILYAYGVWIYRFTLFMGIALLVYHLFFKALGLGLMIVEIVWFIALPIYRELAHWYSRRVAIRFTWQVARSCLMVLSVTVLFVVPWHARIQGAGLLSAKHLAILYTQQPAKVLSIDVQPGEAVKAGQVLARLQSPDLDARRDIARRKLDILRGKLAASSLDPELRFSYALDNQEMLSVASELAGIAQDRAKLLITAPFEGIFRDLPSGMTPGAWVPEKMKLGAVVAGAGLVTAYVPEEDMERLDVGMTGQFYPVSGFFAPLAITVVSLEHSATRDIPQIELPSTVVGGIIPAKRMPNGHNVPEQALYKVVCRVEVDILPPLSVTGKVFISGKRRSFAARFWQAALGVLIRESGLD